MVSTARVERDTIPSKLARLLSSGTVPVSGLTAAVERAHSDRARSGSKRPIRALFLPHYRGGSASKKDGWLPPPYASGRISTSSNLIFRWRWLRSIFKSSAVREMFQ